MKYLITILALVFVGCASEPAVHPVVLVPPTTKIDIPESLLQKCPVLPPLALKTFAQQDMVDLVSQWITASEACRAKQSILVDTVRQAFNIPSSSQPSK